MQLPPCDRDPFWRILDVHEPCSSLLHVPEPVRQIMVERDHTSVVENDGPIFPRDGLAPPFVVDTPALTHDFDTSSGFARQSYVYGLSLLVSAYGDGVRLAERLELGPLTRPFTHGSKLRSAWRRSGIRDHGSTSTTL